MPDILLFIQKFQTEFISIIIVSLASAFHKKILKILSSIYKGIQKPFICMNNTSAILQKIEKEFKPNGGSSLRDAINNIDGKLNNLSKKVQMIQANSDMMSDTLNMCRWAANSKGYINFVNRPLRRLIGAVDNDSCLGEAWFNNIVALEDRTQVRLEWTEVIESGTEYHHEYHIMNIQNNKKIKISSHAKVILDDTGKVQGWTGVIIPITKENSLDIFAH